MYNDVLEKLYRRHNLNLSEEQKSLFREHYFENSDEFAGRVPYRYEITDVVADTGNIRDYWQQRQYAHSYQKRREDTFEWGLVQNAPIGLLGVILRHLLFSSRTFGQMADLIGGGTYTVPFMSLAAEYLAIKAAGVPGNLPRMREAAFLRWAYRYSRKQISRKLDIDDDTLGGMLKELYKKTMEKITADEGSPSSGRSDRARELSSKRELWNKHRLREGISTTNKRAFYRHLFDIRDL